MTDNDDRTRVGREAVGRLRLPGPPVGRPLPSRIGSLASGVQRFATGLSRPVDIRRALAGPGSHEGSVAPPRWWTGAPEAAEASGPAPAAPSSPWLASSRPVAPAELPSRQLPRAAREVPNEATYSPGGIVGGLRSEVARVRRHDEVAAAGPMLTSSDRTKLNAAATVRRRAAAASSSSPAPDAPAGPAPARPAPVAGGRPSPAASALPPAPARSGSASAATPAVPSPATSAATPDSTPAATPAVVTPAAPPAAGIAGSAGGRPGPGAAPAAPVQLASTSAPTSPAPRTAPSSPESVAAEAPHADAASSPVSSGAGGPGAGGVGAGGVGASVGVPSASAAPPVVRRRATYQLKAVASRLAGNLARSQAPLGATSAGASLQRGVGAAEPVQPAAGSLLGTSPAPSRRDAWAATSSVVRRHAARSEQTAAAGTPMRPARPVAGAVDTVPGAGTSSAGMPARSSAARGHVASAATGRGVHETPVQLRARTERADRPVGLAPRLRRVAAGVLPGLGAAMPDLLASARSPQRAAGGADAEGGGSLASAFGAPMTIRAATGNLAGQLGATSAGRLDQSAARPTAARPSGAAAGAAPVGGLPMLTPVLRRASVGGSTSSAASSPASTPAASTAPSAAAAAPGGPRAQLPATGASADPRTATGAAAAQADPAPAFAGADAHLRGLVDLTHVHGRPAAGSGDAAGSPPASLGAPAPVRAPAPGVRHGATPDVGVGSGAPRSTGAAGGAPASAPGGPSPVAPAASAGSPSARPVQAARALRAHDLRRATAARRATAGASATTPSRPVAGSIPGPMSGTPAAPDAGRGLSPASSPTSRPLVAPGVAPGGAPFAASSAAESSAPVGAPPAQLRRRGSAPPPIPAVARAIAPRSQPTGTSPGSGSPSSNLLDRTAHLFDGASDGAEGETAQLRRRRPRQGGGSPAGGASATSVAALQAAVAELRDLVISGRAASEGSSGGTSTASAEAGPLAEAHTREALVRQVIDQVERRVLEELERRGMRDGRSRF